MKTRIVLKCVALTAACSVMTCLNTANAADLYQNGDGLKDAPYAPQPTGFYVGAKIGGSGLTLDDRKTSYNAFNFLEDGKNFSGDYESWNLDGGTAGVFGGGVFLGYGLKDFTGLPVRAEFDYVARLDGSVSSDRDITMNFKVNGVPSAETMLWHLRDKIGLQTALASFYIDIPTSYTIKPYIGGGVGAAFIDQKSNGLLDDVFTGSHSTTNFAWSVGGGLAWAIDDHKTIDLGYRYVDAGDSTAHLSTEEPVYEKVHVASHDVMLGLRYGF